MTLFYFTRSAKLDLNDERASYASTLIKILSDEGGTSICFHGMQKWEWWLISVLSLTLDINIAWINRGNFGWDGFLQYRMYTLCRFQEMLHLIWWLNINYFKSFWHFLFWVVFIVNSPSTSRQEIFKRHHFSRNSHVNPVAQLLCSHHK